MKQQRLVIRITELGNAAEDYRLVTLPMASIDGAFMGCHALTQTRKNGLSGSLIANIYFQKNL